MAMTKTHRTRHQRPTRHKSEIDFVSLGVFFLAVVSILAVLVGALTIGTSLVALIPPTLLGLWALSTLRR